MFLFIGFICWKYGIPETISDSYYLTNKKPWFSIVMIICGLLMIPKALTLSSGWILGLTLSGILGLFATGLFPKFKQKGYQRNLHLFGARWSGVIAQICVILLGFPWIMLTWILPIILLMEVMGTNPINLPLALDKVKFIFWVELVCFINLYIGLLL